MTAWPRIRLADISESVEYGLTASAAPSLAEPKFLRITDIQDDAVDWGTVPGCQCSAEDVEKYALKSGDIVFARTGATTGKSLLVENPPRSAVFASYLIRVRPDERRVDARYLSHFFDTPDYWNQISKGTTGTAQGGVNGTKLKELSVPLPPLPEQKRIAAILDKADAIRRKRQEAIRLTEELLRAAFLEMFGDPVTNPKGWEVRKLGEVGHITTGATPSTARAGMFGGSIPFVTPGDLESELPPRRYLTDEGAASVRTVRTGATLVCCIGATIGKMGVAAVTSAFNQQINAVEWDASVLDEYGFETLRFFKESIAAMAKSTTMPILTKSSFSELCIPVPPVVRQSKLVEVARACAMTRQRRQGSLTLGDDLMASLTQRAFSGRL